MTVQTPYSSMASSTYSKRRNDMQAYRGRALTIIAVLLALTGCPKEQTKPPAAAAPASLATDQIVNNPVFRVLRTNPERNKSEVRLGDLTPGSSTVTWTSETEFYVQFDSAKQNPCATDNSAPMRSYAYNSTFNTSIHQWVATCKIVKKPGGPLRYEIFPKSYPPGNRKKPGKNKEVDSGGHCEGCVIDD